MVAEHSIIGLRSAQSVLQDALDAAASHGDPVIRNCIALALGNVRAEIEARDEHVDITPSLPDLIALVLAALVSADALGRGDTALMLNEALITLTGKGISPEGWPSTAD